MKKRVSLLCLIGLMALCYGCSGKETEDTKKNAFVKEETTDKQDESMSTEEKTTEIETEDESLKKPDEEKMFKDLTERQCNTISFTEWTGTITIPVEKMTLDKAKDENGNYIAYCTLDMKNNYYEATVTYCLKYSYYDIGGWQLEECTEESRKIVSISPDDDTFQSYIKSVCVKNNMYEPTVMNLLMFDDLSNEKQYVWSCTYDATAKRKYADIYYIDTITCYFDQTTGWSFDKLGVKFISDDWTKIIGKKFYTGIDENEYYYLTIVDIDIVNRQVSANIVGHRDNGWRVYSDDIGIYDVEYFAVSNLREYTNGRDSLSEYYFQHDELGVYDAAFTYTCENGAYVSISIELDADYGISYATSPTVGFNINEPLQEVK